MIRYSFFKTSCDVYANLIMNNGTADEAKVMEELLATSTSPVEVLATWKETQRNSPYSTEQKGLAGRYMT